MIKRKKNKFQGPLLMLGGAAFGYILMSLGKGSFSMERFFIDIPTILLALFIGIIAIFIVILIHELGHVIGGLIMGNEFSLLVVGPCKWQKEEGKLSFTLHNDFSTFGGLALTLPTKVEGFKKRRLVTVGGGPLASLLLSALGFYLLWMFGDGAMKMVKTFYAMIGGISFAIFIVTIIPAKMGGFVTDGMQLLMTLRNNAKSKQYADFMQIIALNQQGVLAKDFPSTIISPYRNKKVEDIYDLGFCQFLYHQAVEIEDTIGSAKYIDELENNIDLYPQSFQIGLLAELYIYYSIIAPNEEKRNILIKEIGEDVPKTSQLLANMMLGAIKFIEKDYETANSFFQKVKDSSKKDGISKFYKMLVKHYIDDFKK